MARHTKANQSILFSQQQADEMVQNGQGDIFDQALTQILGARTEEDDPDNQLLRVRIFNTAIDSDGRQVRAR